MFSIYQSTRYHTAENYSFAGTCCLKLSERVCVRFVQNSGLCIKTARCQISKENFLVICGVAVTGDRKAVFPEMLI
jgi:hypothetical protein